MYTLTQQTCTVVRLLHKPQFRDHHTLYMLQNRLNLALCAISHVTELARSFTVTSGDVKIEKTLIWLYWLHACAILYSIIHVICTTAPIFSLCAVRERKRKERDRHIYYCHLCRLLDFLYTSILTFL